jgi:hypothetical protein
MCMIRRYVDRTALSLIVNRYTKVHMHDKGYVDRTVLSLIVNRYTKIHVHVTCDKPTLILNRSTRCRTMVGFTPHMPYPQGQRLQYQLKQAGWAPEQVWTI